MGGALRNLQLNPDAIGNHSRTKASHRTGTTDAASVNDIIIIDSACDQSIINGHAFVVVSRTCEYFHVNGALTGRMEAVKS